MIKYAKIINEEIGLCEVGAGTNEKFYKSIGMIKLDVQQSDIDGKWYLSDKCPMKSDEQKQQEERERLDGLSMTRGDVFEALILAKGLGKTQIRAMIEQAELDDITKLLYLNRFDEALEFYRGYPIFDLLGEKLNITPAMLDNFFETKDYKYLTQVTLTVNVVPETATVTLNGQKTNELIVPYNSTIEVVAECEGYNEYFDTFTLTENKTIDVELKPIEVDTDTDTDTDTERTE